MVSYNRKVANVDASILIQVSRYFLNYCCLEGIYGTAQCCCGTVYLSLCRLFFALYCFSCINGSSQGILGFLRILTWQCAHHSCIVQTLCIRNRRCQRSLVNNRLLLIAYRYTPAVNRRLNDGSLGSYTELRPGDSNRSARILYTRFDLEGQL
ncbi:hypothetical protein D3C87_1404890 [compost metagenome]